MFHNGVATDRYTSETIVALSENQHNRDYVPVFKYWKVRGGSYPHWFLAKNQFTALSDDYHRISQHYLALNPQVIFIYENDQAYGELYCHTPEIDFPGVYGMWQSKVYGRDDALYSVGEEWAYRYHKRLYYDDPISTHRHSVYRSLYAVCEEDDGPMLERLVAH